jgi:hypothetical protein
MDKSYSRPAIEEECLKDFGENIGRKTQREDIYPTYIKVY